ncbi:MAG: hypothetical protein HYV09_21620 [Deltaproteobacteria bacterium]|nr:hypothetical protein [Deltaproteobacteria bacterium]
MRPLRSPAGLAIVALILASCGGGEERAAIDAATADVAGDIDLAEVSPADAPDADPFGAFPSGPYGNAVDSVMANLAWEGYVSPLADAIASTKPWVTTSMDALRRDAKKGYALVHVSEFY